MSDDYTYRLVYGADWRRVQRALEKIRLKKSAEGPGPTLWQAVHLVHTNGERVDFSMHPVQTIFWSGKSLPRSSPIVQQFVRRDLPIRAYDYPPKSRQDAWIASLLSKKKLSPLLRSSLLESVGNDYARLHLEIDKLALCPKHSLKLTPSGENGERFLDSWNEVNIAKMQRSLASLKEAEVPAALERLLNRAYIVWAIQHGQAAGSPFQQMQAKKWASKLPRRWVNETLRLFSQVPPTHLEIAEAVVKLDLERKVKT